MVSKSFDIHTGSLLPFDAASKKLLVEISPSHTGVILWDKEKDAPEAVEAFSGDMMNEDQWHSMLQQSRLLGYTDLETSILIAHPQMIPVPARFYDFAGAKQQLELFFGNRGEMHTGGDVLEKEEMVVAWQLPKDLFECLRGHFKAFRARHIASLLIGRGQVNDNKAQVIIYGNLAWVLVWLNGQFKIAKSVTFLQPDDLSWHLLNICRHLEAEPTDIQWEVAGMVEENSPLWQAITRFLDPVTPMAALVPLPGELPAHYFAHVTIGS